MSFTIVHEDTVSFAVIGGNDGTTVAFNNGSGWYADERSAEAFAAFLAATEGVGPGVRGILPPAEFRRWLRVQ